MVDLDKNVDCQDNVDDDGDEGRGGGTEGPSTGRGKSDG